METNKQFKPTKKPKQKHTISILKKNMGADFVLSFKAEARVLNQVTFLGFFLSSTTWASPAVCSRRWRSNDHRVADEDTSGAGPGCGSVGYVETKIPTHRNHGTDVYMNIYAYIIYLQLPINTN